MIYNSILEAMGNTPMIRLNRINPPTNAEVLVKFEGLNVGGSIKTRTAYQMILAAEQAGVVGPGSIIVEPTSGNQGIGLALVGAVRGYRTIIVMPDSVSIERRKLVQHYGAEVVLVHDDGDIGKCIHECLATAMRMKEQDSRVFAFRRGTVHVIANFSDSAASFRSGAWSRCSTDLITGKTYSNYDAVPLAPYEVLYLKEQL